MNKTSHSEFFYFILVGAIAAAINFISRLAFSEYFSYRSAIILAYLIGMLTAFLLSKYFVFEKSGRPIKEELKDFTVVNIFAIIQVWLISVGLAEYFFPFIKFNYYPESVAHIIGLGIPAITSYFGHKFYSFRKA